MKLYFVALAGAIVVMSSGAGCHIISGGDEIVVAEDDEGGGPTGTTGPTSGNGTSVGVTSGGFDEPQPTMCGGAYACDDVHCICWAPSFNEGSDCPEPGFGPPDCFDVCCGDDF